MSVRIYPIRLGMDDCYVIQDRGTIMVDGGFPGSARAFSKAIKEFSIEPMDIKLIIITHGHFDHFGSASMIREQTGAKLALHQADKEQLDKDKMTWPPGTTPWGRISRGLFKPMMSFLRFELPQVDILLGDEGLSLEAYGISGRIIHTPGHTPGSVTVLLDSGDAFVGCMAQNSLPFCLKPRLPIYAQDIEKIKQNWRMLIAEGAITIYPGHGKPFSVEVIKDML
jgi:hydroxyacylglutathione hydrolase